MNQTKAEPTLSSGAAALPEERAVPEKAAPAEAVPRPEKDVSGKTSLLPKAALPEEPSDGRETAPAEGTPSWEERCRQVEETLSQTRTLFTLAAGYGFVPTPEQEEQFHRLKQLGLTADEAFFAANGARLLSHPSPEGDKKEPPLSSKAHLTSSMPAAYGAQSGMSREERQIAKELLGEDLTTEELEKLYKRVTA